MFTSPPFTHSVAETESPFTVALEFTYPTIPLFSQVLQSRSDKQL